MRVRETKTLWQIAHLDTLQVVLELRRKHAIAKVAPLLSVARLLSASGQLRFQFFRSALRGGQCVVRDESGELVCDFLADSET